MYSLIALPELPTDARLVTALPQQTFIDDIEIHALLYHQRQNWQEQRYLGEDFAGRDDCLLSGDGSHSLPQREQVGAFFTPVSAVPVTAPVLISLAAAPTTSYRPWIIAAASALLLAGGLWAARPDAPAIPTNQQVETAAPILDSYAKSESTLIVIDKRH